MVLTGMAVAADALVVSSSWQRYEYTMVMPMMWWMIVLVAVVMLMMRDTCVMAT